MKTATDIIRAAYVDARSNTPNYKLDQRVGVILKDVILLARCAASKCLITYTDAIDLRGHGNPQNGKWLDEVYAFAIRPMGLPDLTMLVVNKSTKQPSEGAFDARRTILSDIHVDDVPSEQRRCVWFTGYEAVLGPLEPIPEVSQLVRLLTPEPTLEREIARAVDNAIGRVLRAGVEVTSVGKEYPDSLPRSALIPLVRRLWSMQEGRCALTGQAFDQRSDEDGGVADDRVSLDRIDNQRGYSNGNIQLVTQFANRARGTLAPEEAKRRLVQFGG